MRLSDRLWALLWAGVCAACVAGYCRTGDPADAGLAVFAALTFFAAVVRP